MAEDTFLTSVTTVVPVRPHILTPVLPTIGHTPRRAHRTQLPLSPCHVETPITNARVTRAAQYADLGNVDALAWPGRRGSKRAPCDLQKKLGGKLWPRMLRNDGGPTLQDSLTAHRIDLDNTNLFLVKKSLGDERAIERAAAGLEDSDCTSRYRAKKTLGAIAPKSDHCAVDSVTKRLEHKQLNVRKAASSALSQIVEKGSIVGIDAAAERLTHENAEVREAAVEALINVAGVGHPNAISAVAALLTHDADGVRDIAVEALGRIAARGDKTAIEAVSVWLDHPDKSIRQHAMHALSVVSEPDVVKQVDDLGHSDPHVRLAALRSMRNFKGREDAVKEIVKKLTHLDHSIREMAVHALQIVTEVDKGDLQTIESVGRILEHDEVGCRTAAIKAFAAIADEGDADALEAAARRLEHANPAVRSTAAQAICSIARPGNKKAIAEVVKRLGHREECVRRSASKALSRAAERGDTSAVALTMEWLLHPDGAIRKTAVQALGGIVDKADAVAMPVVLSCLEDGDSSVREMAIKSLKQIMEAPMALVKTTKGFMLKEQLRPDLIGHQFLDRDDCSYQDTEAEMQITQECDDDKRFTHRQGLNGSPHAF